MEKVIIQKDLFSLPWTQTILGTHHQGKPNFMALDWLTRTNYQPAMLGICDNKRNLSNTAILETGEFSINLPSVDMVEITDYTGIVSGKDVDKSILFEVFYGKLKAAPMISQVRSQDPYNRCLSRAGRAGEDPNTALLNDVTESTDSPGESFGLEKLLRRSRAGERDIGKAEVFLNHARPPFRWMRRRFPVPALLPSCSTSTSSGISAR